MNRLLFHALSLALLQFPILLPCKINSDIVKSAENKPLFLCLPSLKRRSKWSVGFIPLAYRATFLTATQTTNRPHTAKNTISRHSSTRMPIFIQPRAMTSPTLQSELITGVRTKRIQGTGVLRTLDLSYALTLQEK